MTVHRTFTAAVAGAALLLLAALPAAPALAHGAMTRPVSRAAACGTEGGERAQSRACRAALDASGVASFGDWDTVRVPGVNGRDRERIPDGQLCSGGIPAFAGFDAARSDWPSTSLRAGDEITFTYRATIPHRGTFRLYVTADGYDPTTPLRWADLEREPFLTVKDPSLRDGSYRFEGTLPPDRTGKAVIYAVWQNSDTPDTYYSCSDVVFKGPAGTGGSGAAEGGDAGAGTDGAAASEAPPDEAPTADVGAVDPAAATGPDGRLPLLVGAAAIFAILAGGAMALRGRRRF
jgi:chitin-binding protein